MLIRQYQDNDLESIATLFTESVRQVNILHYSEQQVTAAAPRPPNLARWRKRIAGIPLWVAELDGQIIGFCGLRGNGHVDLLYTDYRFQRHGVAQALYQQAETEALQQGVRRFFTEASINARPFFEKMGFAMIREQEIEFCGLMFRNYVMEKLVTLPDNFDKRILTLSPAPLPSGRGLG